MRRIAVLGALALSGCAAVWGAPYKVDFSSPSSVTINTDPSLTNMGEVQRVAQAECQKYGRDAVPQTYADGPWGLREISFTCRTP